MPTAPSTPIQIEIVVDGRLDPRRSGWFEGMTLTNLPDGATRITGTVADQAALYGMISRIRDLGLKLISVTTNNPASNEGFLK